jgi:hypothetical protein
MTRRVIPVSATVAPAADVLTTEFGDEVVMLNLSDGVYYGLDEVGARVWAMLKQPVVVSEICSTLVREFDVEPERCERDLLDLLRELVSRGLIEIRDQP